MQTREAPNWLYECLPYLYVVIGTLAVSGFEWRSSTLGGVIFVLVGLALFRLRIRYRLKSVHQITFRLGALR